MKIFIINENDSGQRIDKFISKALPDLPKSMMYRLFRQKDVKLNGKRCDFSAKLNCGDEVKVYVKDDVSAPKKADMSFLKAPSDLNIVYEDSSVIIVNKPQGLDSHPGGSFSDNLIDRIKHYLYDKGEYSPENEASFAPALTSRLDRNTCGLVTAAKKADALRELNYAIKNGLVTKIYRCITVSAPPEDAVLTAYHKKEESRNIVRISDTPLEDYKLIKTGCHTVSSHNGLYLAEITLYTGRTHQIRAHLAHIGAPVLGDGKYGNIAVNKRYGEYRQTLCAYSLKFSFPEGSPLRYLNDIVIKARTPDFEKKYFGQLG